MLGWLVPSPSKAELMIGKMITLIRTVLSAEEKLRRRHLKLGMISNTSIIHCVVSSLENKAPALPTRS